MFELSIVIRPLEMFPTNGAEDSWKVSLKTDLAISPQGIATLFANSGDDKFVPLRDIRVLGFTSAFV